MDNEKLIIVEILFEFHAIRMKKENPIRKKSYILAVQIVRFCRFLAEENKEYILSKQLMRSGTSICANIEESQQAQSRKDFVCKLRIALKESYETHYWLRLIRDSNITTSSEMNSLIQKTLEVTRMLVAIVKTTTHQ
jgi:four helix bundle protein